MGIDGKDKCFEYNYIEAKKEGFNVGVYHYYRPNENSMQQFDNLRNVLGNKLLDFPIVIDIEVSSTIQPMDKLIIGVNKLSIAIEKEYGVKPIIYTGLLTTSGLTGGSEYYVADTKGAIATSAGTKTKKVGRAVSSTAIMIKNDND